ncbi:BMP family ABC transporter substrate-binding protein [Neiella marina]|uniref:BMP family ABC transporter substrate-binding protein n=2 Tax=Neiella holothuriorum TaxID=2870530 RepID=A0ABS7EE60_9GAMM|nr:BMP family ABC transporter substrate-binding protein [Neiella holothuriorum]
MFGASLSMSAIAKDVVKVGFVYIGPTGDTGWTYSHDMGRQFVEQRLGDKVSTTYIENVSDGADAERVIRRLAKSGHDLIFTTSFGFMNPTLKVARSFPNVAFEHASGYKRTKNVGTYFDRVYQPRYLTGVIAGKMTQSNVIGYVASFPIPEVIRGINAFTLGLRSVNPEATVKVVWVSAWYDPAKEREAADALIGQGADIISQHTNSPGPVQAAEAKGVYSFGYNADMSSFGENTHLTAAIHNWGPMYLAKTQAVLDGKWKSTDVWAGLEANATDLAPYHPAIPKDVIELVERKKLAITQGSLHPFSGPIKDQTGQVRVADGETMNDRQLLGFDWYVEGVVGELPK